MDLKERAEQLDSEGKCIIDGEVCERRTRGLCRMHHGRFMASLARVSPEKRERFERFLIATGKLLPNRKGKKVRPEDDEFQVAAEEFEAAIEKQEQNVAELGFSKFSSKAKKIAADISRETAEQMKARKAKKESEPEPTKKR